VLWWHSSWSSFSNIQPDTAQQYKYDNTDANWLAINAVRCLAADMVQKANSGRIF